MVLEKFFLLEKYGLHKREFVTFSFSLVNILAWYFMTQQIIEILSTNLEVLIYQKVTIMGIYYFAIVFSSLCNAFIALKAKRRSLLLTWIGLGIIASLLPLIIAANSFESLTLVSFLFGFSFGIGMPSCLSFLADETIFENRGRSGGLIFFLANILAVSFVIFNALVNNFMLTLLYVAIWRITNICIFRLAELNRTEIKRSEQESFTTILRNRAFILYWMPWLMFSLVDSLEKAYLQPYISNYFGQSFFTFNQLMEALIGALFALIAGIIMDLIGRKRVIVYGFISLGLAYATIGFAPHLDILWYLYSIVDGIAWSIFTVIFTVVIWGDLSTPSNFREKYYALGGIPLFISKFIGALFLPYTQALPKETAYAAFSLAAFFLFLAVVPLMYAPETLPEKKIRERELRGYVEKAKKIREKFT